MSDQAKVLDSITIKGAPSMDEKHIPVDVLHKSSGLSSTTIILIVAAVAVVIAIVVIYFMVRNANNAELEAAQAMEREKRAKLSAQEAWAKTQELEEQNKSLSEKFEAATVNPFADSSPVPSATDFDTSGLTVDGKTNVTSEKVKMSRQAMKKMMNEKRTTPADYIEGQAKRESEANDKSTKESLEALSQIPGSNYQDDEDLESLVK